VVTPSYNQGEFLERTIRSVIDQEYPDFQYLVVDGGSGDGSAAIIERYADRIDRWVSEPDRGQSHAINKGMAMADGELVAWINSDDALLPGALQAWAASHAAHPEAAAYLGLVDDVDRGGSPLGREPSRKGTPEQYLLWGARGGRRIRQPGVAIRRACWERVGGLDETLHNVMDVDLWVRLAAVGEFVELDRAVAINRIYPETKTRSRFWEREVEHLWLCLKHRMPHCIPERLRETLRQDEAIAGLDVEHLLRHQIRAADLLKALPAKIRNRLD